MGGDFAPNSTIEGALLANKEIGEECSIVLIGKKEIIEEKLLEFGSNGSEFEILDAPDVVEMGDNPTKVFSQKPKSSIAIGFGVLQEKKIDALCSVGNTGALLVGSMYTVRAIPGIIRPSVTAVVPKENGGVGILLDVGTNADCKPDVLYQFAILGSLYLNLVYKIENPKVGLLNIGKEEGKGNLLTQATYSLMKGTSDFNFVGNIEGRDLFSDSADVIVCDGFTGNVV